MPTCHQVSSAQIAMSDTWSLTTCAVCQANNIGWEATSRFFFFITIYRQTSQDRYLLKQAGSSWPLNHLGGFLWYHLDPKLALCDPISALGQVLMVDTDTDRLFAILYKLLGQPTKVKQSSLCLIVCFYICSKNGCALYNNYHMTVIKPKKNNCRLNTRPLSKPRIIVQCDRPVGSGQSHRLYSCH